MFCKSFLIVVGIAVVEMTFFFFFVFNLVFSFTVQFLGSFLCNLSHMANSGSHCCVLC